MPSNLLERKSKAFVLWRFSADAGAPKLVLGRLQSGAPIQFIDDKTYDFQRVSGFNDLWEIAVDACRLEEGQIYHYWFALPVPGQSEPRRITDPTAYMVDWRLVDPDSGAPAAVIQYRDGALQPADAEGAVGNFHGEPKLNTLPANNRIVIYELPTAWTVSGNVGGRDIGIGSFTDVAALVDVDTDFVSFDWLDFRHIGDQYLVDLGINALELLPPADSSYNRQWDYGTTNYYAPDFEYGFSRTYTFPAPNRDLVNLVRTLHSKHIRFFADTVLGFAKDSPLLSTAANDFFLLNPGQHHDDPDSKDSRGGYRGEWGGNIWRYIRTVDDAFDPETGERKTLVPARQYLKAALMRWMRDFHLDGLRLDSVETIANWDFVEEYKELARSLNRARFAEQGTPDDADARMLVVGEELGEPRALLEQTTADGKVHRRLDGLWHEKFKSYIRHALQGHNHPDNPSFEWDRPVRHRLPQLRLQRPRPGHHLPRFA